MALATAKGGDNALLVPSATPKLSYRPTANGFWSLLDLRAVKGAGVEASGNAGRLNLQGLSDAVTRARSRPLRYTPISVYRITLVLWLCLSLASCIEQPNVYAPPAQRKPPQYEVLFRTQPMLEMSDPAAEHFFVQDIATGLQEPPWRWTGKRPTIRIHLRNTVNYRYQAVFAVADATFKDTGPVSITFYVNGQPLDTVKYASPGEKTFEKAVPLPMLKPMTENTLAAEIDKLWTAPDNATFGFILVRMGLVQ